MNTYKGLQVDKHRVQYIVGGILRQHEQADMHNPGEGDRQSYYAHDQLGERNQGIASIESIRHIKCLVGILEQVSRGLEALLRLLVVLLGLAVRLTRRIFELSVELPGYLEQCLGPLAQLHLLCIVVLTLNADGSSSPLIDQI